MKSLWTILTMIPEWVVDNNIFYPCIILFFLFLSLCACVYTERELIICVCTYIHIRICVCVCVCMLSWLCQVQLFATLWTIAHQAPLSMGFSRQEYWVGCHAFLHDIFPTQGSNPCLLCLLHKQVGSLRLAPPGRPHTSGQQTSPTDTCKWLMYGSWLKQSWWWNMKEIKPISFNSV